MYVPTLEPTNSKNNEILEIYALQKFTPHALFPVIVVDNYAKNDGPGEV